MRYKKIILPVLFVLAFLLGMLICHLTRSSLTEDQSFEQYASQLFRQQISQNTINLHYTLANPELYGIKNHKATLGHLVEQGEPSYYDTLRLAQDTLQTFTYDALSTENQLLYDTLSLSISTDLDMEPYGLMVEVLSPSLGIQAQLPILLAEYTFESKSDVKEYLDLIALMDSYFSEILTFEKEKAAAGYFMNDQSVDRVIAQCSSFIANPDQNYLLSIFSDKINSCSFLSEKEKSKYIAAHQLAISEHLIPAYEQLVQGLNELKGNCQNPQGLVHFPNGANYYELLVKQTTGIYDHIPTLEHRLLTELKNNHTKMQQLFALYPSLASLDHNELNSLSVSFSPDEMLLDLQKKMQVDFPVSQDYSYDLKYVHPDLSEYLSPAFYLTPPLDTLVPNSIYLNQSSNLTGLTLYTTLAHEAFPGHLFQTQYFGEQNRHPLRSLLEPGGYVEGWATYIEQYAYSYAPAAQGLGELLWLNRSMNLCIYSLLDIGIHYRGWSLEDMTSFLENFGINHPDSLNEIYLAILEDPANYLQYCLGSLYLQDLRLDMEVLLNQDFDLQKFHKKILEIGPCQFPVLKKYLFDAV